MFPASDLFIAAENEYRRERMTQGRPVRRARREHKPRRRHNRRLRAAAPAGNCA